MMYHLRTLTRCLYDALVDTINHDGIEHAGYLAFLALLSIFPFLVFFIAIAGFLGESDAGAHIINTILSAGLIPEHVKTALDPRIDEIILGPPQGLLTLAIVGAIWTASSAVEGMRTTLNRAYRVYTPPAYWWRRLRSIIEFLVLTALLLLVTLLFIVAPIVFDTVKDILHLPALSLSPFWDSFRYGMVTFVAFLVVSAFYFILPNLRQRWRNVVPGACIVVLLWFLSGTLFSMYLKNFHQVYLIYGSLGGIIAALLFFYFTAMIFIYGAEFNYRLEKALGHTMEPKEKEEG